MPTSYSVRSVPNTSYGVRDIVSTTWSKRIWPLAYWYNLQDKNGNNILDYLSKQIQVKWEWYTQDTEWTVRPTI